MNRLYRTPDDIQYAIASGNDPIKNRLIASICWGYIDKDKFITNPEYNKETTILLAKILADGNYSRPLKEIASEFHINRINTFMNYNGVEDLTKSMSDAFEGIMRVHNNGELEKEYQAILQRAESDEFNERSLMALAQILYYLNESKGSLTSIDEDKKEKIRLFLHNEENRNIINKEFHQLLLQRHLKVNITWLRKNLRKISKGKSPDTTSVQDINKGFHMLKKGDKYDIVNFILQHLDNHNEEVQVQ